jgi:hypothetical protein
MSGSTELEGDVLSKLTQPFFPPFGLRSYKSYEKDADKEGTIKYAYILEKLKALNGIRIYARK